MSLVTEMEPHAISFCVKLGENATTTYGKLQKAEGRVLRVRANIARNWILHHDNAPSHTALSVQQFLTSKQISVLPQPPYSPDIAPRVKTVVKGHHFQTTQDVQKAVTRVLEDITEDEFQKCYHQWQKRWKKCVQSEGNYFEGDNTKLD